MLEFVQVGLHIGNSGRCVGLASLEFGNAGVKARKLAFIKGLGLRGVLNGTKDSSNRGSIQAGLCPGVLLLERVNGGCGGGRLSFKKGRGGFGGDKTSRRVFTHRVMDLNNGDKRLVNDNSVLGGQHVADERPKCALRGGVGGLERARWPLEVLGQALKHGAVDAFGQGAHVERELGIRVSIAEARAECRPDSRSVCFGDPEAMAAAKTGQGDNAAVRGLVCAEVFKRGLGQPDHREGRIWGAAIRKAWLNIESMLAGGAVEHGECGGGDANHEVEAGGVRRWGA